MAVANWTRKNQWSLGGGYIDIFCIEFKSILKFRKYFTNALTYSKAVTEPPLEYSRPQIPNFVKIYQTVTLFTLPQTVGQTHASVSHTSTFFNFAKFNNSRYFSGTPRDAQTTSDFKTRVHDRWAFSMLIKWSTVMTSEWHLTVSCCCQCHEEDKG